MVKVVAGQTSTADAVMRRSCTLSGVVTDSRTNQPVAGVQVEPVLAPGQPPQTQVYPTSGGLTDATGAYTNQPASRTASTSWSATASRRCTASSTGRRLHRRRGGHRIALTPSAASAVADIVLRHDDTRPATAALNSIKMRTRSTAKLKFRVTDAYGASAKLTLVVATTKGKVKARVKLGVRAINEVDVAKWRPSGFAPGKYTWWVTATDLAGNTQSSILKKAMVLTR